MENFFVDFQIKINKVKATGTVLSDGVLAYALLNAANLPDDKLDMVKATCEQLKFKNVKSELEKIGFAKIKDNNNSTDLAKVKVENCYYGANMQQNHQDYNEELSDEDLNGEKIYYSRNKLFQHQSSNGKHKLNPTDRFGHVRACTFCKCLYHWLADCPYAPATVKNNLRNKDNQARPFSKPL